MAREKVKPCGVLASGDVGRWDSESDVVIVGLGGAGACAAIAAAESGAETLVLERASAGGGTTEVSDGMMYIGGGTSLQQACGFEDSPEEMFKFLMASVGPEPDEERIRAFCEGGPAHYDWLVAQGVPFEAEFYAGRMLSPEQQGLTYSGNELVHPFPDLAVPAPRAHMAACTGPTGAFLMQKLLERALALGVRIQPDTRAETLVCDPDGRVVGVYARQTGRDQYLRARRGVVLCAGGFINNQEMVRQFAPSLMKAQYHAATDGDDGRGIRMGMGAGGAAVRMHTGQITLPFYPPKGLMRGVFVNAQAQRFIAEDAYQGTMGEVCLLEQHGRVWLILDDEIFERPAYAEPEIAGVGESIEELEAEVGFPEGALQFTIEAYNRDARRGEDRLFHKGAEYLKPLETPPFAAFDMSWDKIPYAVFTLGGLRTNARAEVLSVDGIRIPGLFAAGRTAASISSPGYASGTSVGEATFFGRVAGFSAAGGGA